MKIETFYRIAAVYPIGVEILLEKIAAALCIKAELEYTHTTVNHAGWTKSESRDLLAASIVIDKSILRSPLHDHLRDNLEKFARDLESGRVFPSKSISSLSQRIEYMNALKEGVVALQELYELTEHNQIANWTTYNIINS